MKRALRADPVSLVKPLQADGHATNWKQKVRAAAGRLLRGRTENKSF